MLDIAMGAFVLLFAIGAGMFVGAANYGGWLSALPLGIVLGLLLCIPFRDTLWPSCALLMAGTIIGALIIWAVPDDASMKVFFRTGQNGLNIKAGPYRLGSDSDKL